jgi:peptide/nickel transport system substrate-binding protein
MAEDRPPASDDVVEPQGHDGGSLSREDFLRTAAGGAALLALGAAAGSVPAASAAGSRAAAWSGVGRALPKKGGNLRVAMVGGTAADSLDGDDEINFPQVMRNFALYNGLVALDKSGKKISLDLAEEMTPSKDAMSWTIRLRPDLTFHNGKPVTAQDVLYTFTRIVNPKTPHSGGPALIPLDLRGAKVLDKRTLRLPMKTPYATFVEQICGNYYFAIVPVGYNPKHPVGTGPFKYGSFTPGKQSVFDRNPNYHKSGLPYLDHLTIVDSFSDPTSAFSAVSAGQVDIAENAPPVLVNQVKGNSKLKALISEPGLWIPFTMRCDVAPFNDNRVRMAFKLIVDRPQMINVSVNGLGVVGNDVYGQWDPCYDHSLHRHQDIAKAKDLLKKSGHEGLSVELVTSQFTAGAVEAAQAFAQQAKAAGVKVKVREIPVTDFFTNYTKWHFSQDFLSYSPFASIIAQTGLPTSPFNTTHFVSAKQNALYRQANATVNQKKRCQLIKQMERIQFEEGGYIIASFNKQVDIMAKNVNGFGTAGTGIPLGNGDWEHAWLA